jgi:hypothetical protein
LDLLQSNIGFLHADTDAKFRNEVLSSTRHLVERLRAATTTLKRELQAFTYASRAVPSSSSEDIQEQRIRDVLQKHLGFFQWYLRFLAGELVPTASYQRHITSLRAINLIIRSGVLSHSTPSTHQENVGENVEIATPPLFSNTFIRLLLDCVVDPFEDVRVSATEVLKFAPRHSFDDHTTSKSAGVPQREPLGLLKDFKKRVEIAAQASGRADLADGASRCHELLYHLAASNDEKISIIEEMIIDLEKKVEVAERGLSRAVTSAPIHGQYASIR